MIESICLSLTQTYTQISAEDVQQTFSVVQSFKFKFNFHSSSFKNTNCFPTLLRDLCCLLTADQFPHREHNGLIAAHCQLWNRCLCSKLTALSHTRLYASFSPTNAAVVPNTGTHFDVRGSPLKGQFTPKSKIQIFPLTCSAIYQSRLFSCELPSFGDIL